MKRHSPHYAGDPHLGRSKRITTTTNSAAEFSLTVTIVEGSGFRFIGDSEMRTKHFFRGWAPGKPKMDYRSCGMGIERPTARSMNRSLQPSSQYVRAFRSRTRLLSVPPSPLHRVGMDDSHGGLLGLTCQGADRQLFAGGSSTLARKLQARFLSAGNCSSSTVTACAVAC